MPMERQTSAIDRRSGVAVWRQIADELRSAIASGEFSANGKLPGEIALAERFDVNRHTVRAALAALAREGIVEASPGIGTRIIRAAQLRVPISRRTRFSSGLSDQANKLETTFISSAIVAAPNTICDALDLTHGAQCVALETLSLADSVPVSIALHYFSAERFGEIDIHFRRERSITKALAVNGVADYVRASTDIAARHAREDERQWLKLAPGAIVLEATAINQDTDGKPIQYSLTRFSADRVSMRVDFQVTD